MARFPDVLIPSVPLTLSVTTAEGTQDLHFKLAYDFNGLPLAEQKLGVSLLTGRVFAKLTANVVAVMLWAAVQKFHPEYTGEEGLAAIRTYLTLRNSAKASEAVQEAYVLSLPDDQQQAIRAASARVAVKDPNVPAPESAQ